MTPSCKQAYRVTATFLAFLLILSPAPGVAQSLGDAARQERERRQNMKQRATRVLTNEDLAKPQILDPLDRVRLLAAPGQLEALPPALEAELTVAAPAPGESQGVLGLPPNVSLGDVARYYRLKKLLGEDALASRVRPANRTAQAAQQSVRPPAFDTAPMSTAVSALPAPLATGQTDLFPSGPGTPPGIVLGDVARSYGQQKAVRADATGLTAHPGRAPELAVEQVQAPMASPPRSLVNVTPAPSLPTTTAQRVAPAAPTGPGIPPDVSLGDVARQLREQQAAPWLSRQESAAPMPASELSSIRVAREHRAEAVPSLPETAPIPAQAQELGVPSALKVFAPAAPSAQLPASTRLLRVVKLTEQDVLLATTLVEVARGDSLWRIAARHLGSGRRWKELHAHNPEIRNPHLIHAGDVVRVPHETVVERRREHPVLFVRAGDTLWGLAALQFGRGEAWNCIARANPELRDPNVILPGQELVLPESCSEAL